MELGFPVGCKEAESVCCCPLVHRFSVEITENYFNLALPFILTSSVRLLLLTLSFGPCWGYTSPFQTNLLKLPSLTIFHKPFKRNIASLDSRQIF